MKCDNKVSGNSGKKLRETTIIYERNIKTINYGPLTIVWIISLTHLSDKCHPAVVQIMTVIFQSQRQERPDSFAAEQCWESHGGLSAARSMWHWHLRRWVRGQARPLFLFNQFSVLRPTFTIEVATPKNQPVLIQVDCERSLLLKYMYVCCQAVTSSGRCKPNCNAHVVLRDWQSNLFSHFHMRMCEKKQTNIYSYVCQMDCFKRKSTLSYLCIKSYWKLELQSHWNQKYELLQRSVLKLV